MEATIDSVVSPSLALDGPIPMRPQISSRAQAQVLSAVSLFWPQELRSVWSARL